MKNAPALISTQEFSVDIVRRYADLSPATHTDVFTSATPALSVLKKEAGEKVPKTYIGAMLADIEQFYNVKQSLTEVQLRVLSDMILKQYYFFKVADLRLFAERFKLGLYGKVYERIDGGVIMQALEAYAEERMSEAEEYSQKAASKHKGTGSMANADVLQAIADQWKDFVPEKKPKPVFRTIEDYCAYYELSKDEVIARLTEQIRSAHASVSGIEYEQYEQYYINQFLYEKTLEARSK